MTKFYTDIKVPVRAGMQFCYDGTTKNNKIKTIGFDIIRIYFDSIEKDCVIGQKRLKRILK